MENQPKWIIDKVFTILSKETISKIEDFRKYPIYSAAYNMTIDYIKVYDDIDVEQALEDIKQQVSQNDSEIVGYVFVVDHHNNLKGLLKTEILISSSPKDLIKDLIEETPYVYDINNLNEVKKVIEENEQSFIPVVNKKIKLLGVIGAEDFLANIITISNDVMHEGISSSKVTKPYSQQSSYELFKSRAFWIILLLIIGSITQIMIIGFQLIWQNNGIWNYNGAAVNVGVSSIITLGLTTSLSVSSSINDASGNAGSQSSSTLIKAIATKEVDESMFGKIIRKEIYAGMILGITVALTSIVRMWVIWGIMGQFQNINSWFEFYWYFIISLIAALSFFVAIIMGNLIGALLPMIAAKSGKDATLFSGPLQTTIVDIITFLVYLSLTTLVFVLAADYINSHDPSPTLNLISLSLY